MRFCVALPCFFGAMEMREALARVRALGYDAAETYQWKGLDLDAVRGAIEESGVELLSMCTTDFRLTVPAARGEYLAGLRESCEAARALGVKRLITQGGPDTGEPRAAQHAAIEQTLRDCRPILEHYGVTLMLEPLNTRINHPDAYLSSSEEAFDLVRKADSPYVRVIYDIYHQQITEGSILSNVRANLPLIAHMHAAGSDGRHELWLGENDYGYIFKELDRLGYRGACGLEYSPTLPPEQSLALVKERYGN
ncbi:MAG: TIM barrel protein [Clostridia bacterium]|nr:TIM barrel protein [Clostridia bacterium]